MSEYKCNLVIPGVAKSGTSSLHSYLATHPDVCMSSPKEPHFFSMDVRWNHGPKYHNKLFDDCTHEASVFGESSTTYFITDAALGRISRSLSSPKIIVVLREPVSRAVSHYRWLYALGLENKSMLDAIKNAGYEFDPNRPNEGCYTGYLEFSSYTKWVPKWQREFGSDNVLLLNSDELKNNTVDVLEKCAGFLGVKNIDWNVPEQKNRTQDVAMRAENGLSKFAKRVLPKNLKDSLSTHAPALVQKWNDMFVSHVKRPAPKVTDPELTKIQELLSDEHAFYCSLFGKAS